MDDIKIDYSFAHDYSIEQLHELESNVPIIYIPRTVLGGGKDGHLVRITPQGGDSWIGLFAFGEISRAGLSAAYSCPDPRSVCVVARGRGYIVPVDAPSSYQELGPSPIREVRPITARGLLVFATPWKLLAVDRTGVAWETRRLAVDGFRITRVSDDFIWGEGDPYDYEGSEFRVDLSNGSHLGGLQEQPS